MHVRLMFFIYFQKSFFRNKKYAMQNKINIFYFPKSFLKMNENTHNHF